MIEVDEDDARLDEEEFRPTAAMRRYAESCATGKEPDEKHRVKPATVKRWKYREEFRTWLRREVEELRHGEASELWIVVLGRAKDGDLKALKLYLDRFDRKGSGKKVEMPETFLDVALLAKKARENPPEMYMDGYAGPDEGGTDVTDDPVSGYDAILPKRRASNDDESMHNGAQPCTAVHNDAERRPSHDTPSPAPAATADGGPQTAEASPSEESGGPPSAVRGPTRTPPELDARMQEVDALVRKFRTKVNTGPSPLLVARAFAAHLTRHTWPELVEAVDRAPRGTRPEKLPFERDAAE